MNKGFDLAENDLLQTEEDFIPAASPGSLQELGQDLGMSDFNYEPQALGKMMNRVRFWFLSKSENVALARASVAAVIANSKEDALDMTLSQLEEIKVAVSEGVSNAIIHGYLNQEDQEVAIEVTLWEHALVIKITDEGVGIADIPLAMTPNFSSQPHRMGLGFAFMNSFTDKLLVHSQPNLGTTITMIKKLPLAEL